MKTPEQVAAQVAATMYPNSVAGWLGGDDTLAGRLDKANHDGEIDGEMILGLMAEAVMIDRSEIAGDQP